MDDGGVVAALRALAEPHRLALVQALRQRERCVSDLVDVSGLSQPLVSHHLRTLANVGLVTTRLADGYRHYALDAGALKTLAAAVAGVLDADGLPPEARPGGNAACCR